MIIENIFDKAIQKHASDIHLVCGAYPMLRVARALTALEEFNKLSIEDMYEIYDYIIRGSLQKDEYFKKNKKLDSSLEYNNVRFRVNISNSNNLPVFTLRLIKKELPKYEELGIPDITRKFVMQKQGLILITGKTNSGKTTTLNALLNEINENESKKIITLEHPIEYRHTCKKSIIVQKEIGIDGDALCYADGVNNSLREDADILTIGEIRDKETMDAAIGMAESRTFSYRKFAYKIMCRNNR